MEDFNQKVNNLVKEELRSIIGLYKDEIIKINNQIKFSGKRLYIFKVFMKVARKVNLKPYKKTVLNEVKAKGKKECFDLVRQIPVLKKTKIG